MRPTSPEKTRSARDVPCGCQTALCSGYSVLHEVPLSLGVRRRGAAGSAPRSPTVLGRRTPSSASRTPDADASTTCGHGAAPRRTRTFLCARALLRGSPHRLARRLLVPALRARPRSESAQQIPRRLRLRRSFRFSICASAGTRSMSRRRARPAAAAAVLVPERVVVDGASSA